jgi:RNA polymerase sigma factor (sigma-70 family)
VSDVDLLNRYVGQADEAAFEALVRRHGPMVLGVCRRVLGNEADAEDAFQATFLVLVRKASTLRSPETLANWLYGVASRTALHARRTADQRRVKESAVPLRTAPPENPWIELLPVLDQELERLPEKYRAVLVLCDLEGKTRRETAQLLHCAEGTVASRLARGRARLAQRLARHGPAITVGSLAGLLSPGTASGFVPTPVLLSTLEAASLFAAGRGPGAISVKVAALTKGVLNMMLPAKLKVFAVLLVAVGITGVAAALLNRLPAADDTSAGVTEGSKRGAGEKEGGKPKAPKEDEEAAALLQGKWTVIAADNFARKSYRGHPLGKTGATILIRDRAMFVLDQSGKINPDDKITLHFDFSRKPKWVDFQISPGISSPGICDVNESILTLCWDEKGRERPTRFSAPPDSSLVLWVLKRTGK